MLKPVNKLKDRWMKWIAVTIILKIETKALNIV
jgi:hypothetical protein